MENSDDDIDENETEWKRTDSQVFPATASATNFSEVTPVILHFDLDCFYAQVEMIRNPELRNVPLGIQQKYIIVTCNYVARDLGVTKLMSVTDAKEKCPQLVLVKGEDLTHYREMSYKVTELLMSYSPLVERLGFDENFVDVTELVEKKQRQTPEATECSFKGHVYNHVNVDTKASKHPRLAAGSHIAEELRAAIYSKLGLTGCAGIATNKLLAKLVSGTFKPNQQTTLLPENITDIMASLSSLRKVPGVGHQTAKRLQALGLVSVLDLQLFPLGDLIREFGGPTAQRLHNLALGIDESPVTPTGAPQSLSDEDSFKKMSSTKEVLSKVQDLLSNLVERMQKDGRQPQTFRLTIRRYSATNKWFSRESRQCPIPNHIGQKIISGSSDAQAQLTTMAMKLFHKMVNGSAPFHLTLINVCFSNLQAKGVTACGKGSITSFFTHSTYPGNTQSSSQMQDDLFQNGHSSSMDHGLGCYPESNAVEGMMTQGSSHLTAPPESPPNTGNRLFGPLTRQSPVGPRIAPQSVTQTTAAPLAEKDSDTLECKTGLPPSVDPEVFRLLPEEIQKELLSPAYVQSLHVPRTQVGTKTVTAKAPDTPRMSNNNTPQQSVPPAPWQLTDSDLKEKADSTEDMDLFDKVMTVDQRAPPGSCTVLVEGTAVEEGSPTGQTSSLQTFCCDFPADVDPDVFSELPQDVQRELLSEWKQQRPVLKIPSSKKQGKNSSLKDRKAAAKGSQANNLLKYFKPS